MNTIKRMVGGNSGAFVSYLRSNDPEFAKFVDENMAKGPVKAFADAGLDFNQFSSLL